MLNNILYKRTVSFTLLLVVFLTLIFVPKRPALAAFEASHISVRSYSNADWVDRYSGGDSLTVLVAPDWVLRHAPAAGSAKADYYADWVERHATKGSVAPESLMLPFYPSNYFSR
jgi:hypothetical protein